MTKIVIPPPSQIVTDDEARFTDPWRFHLDKTNTAVNSASQLISHVALSTGTTGQAVAIPQGWRSVRMHFWGVAITSTAGSLCVSLSSNNGVSYVSTGYTYNRLTVDETTSARSGSTNDSCFKLVEGFTTSVSVFGEAKLIQPHRVNPRFFFQTFSQSPAAAAWRHVTGAGRVVVDGITSVLIHTTAGAFSTGEIDFYGDR